MCAFFTSIYVSNMYVYHNNAKEDIHSQLRVAPPIHGRSLAPPARDANGRHILGLGGLLGIGRDVRSDRGAPAARA